jgi:hypothetical protein
MHVVFINERYWGADPESKRMSVLPQIMEHTFESADIGTWSAIYCDAEEIEHNGKIYKFNGSVDQALISLCTQVQPDVIIFTPLRRNELPPNPDRVTLAYIAWKMNIPIIGFFGDIGPASIHMFDKYFPMCCHAIIHYPYPDFRKYAGPRWSCDWWPPLDHRYIYDNTGERQNVVAIPGLLHGQRKEMVSILENAGVNVHTTDQEALPPFKEYCDLLRRVTISVYPGRPDHLEHKPYEIIGCGALLIVSRDSLTRERFDEGTEYVAYDKWWDLDLSPEDIHGRKQQLAEITSYYLNHPDEASAIARRGAERVATEYTATKFWLRLFDRVGIQ